MESLRGLHKYVKLVIFPWGGRTLITMSHMTQFASQGCGELASRSHKNNRRQLQSLLLDGIYPSDFELSFGLSMLHPIACNCSRVDMYCFLAKHGIS
jgi:hypothetical protein